MSFTRKKAAASSDWLEQAAQYGFACYAKMLTVSIENDVPIVTDM